MRARGLKQRVEVQPAAVGQVAPHAGAWIETLNKAMMDKAETSRPMRARGLKQATGC